MSISPGDEVIVPSFTFSSCANAVILAGGVPVFVDVRPDTLNIDWEQAEDASYGKKVKAIMPVHYAGVSADVWPRTGTRIIEDAAQAIGNFKLVGDFGCISFHKSKNVGCGEGGALIVREDLYDKAHIFAHCGTTHPTPNWDWVSLGTHGLMSEYAASELWKNLQRTDEINTHRKKVWRIYRELVQVREKAREVGNGHIFWFLTQDRDEVLARLNARGIKAVKHYTPLHNRGPGLKYGGNCPVAEDVSARIVRLPMNVTEDEAVTISNQVNEVLYEQQGRSVRGIPGERSEQGQASGGAGDQRQAA